MLPKAQLAESKETLGHACPANPNSGPNFRPRDGREVTTVQVVWREVMTVQVVLNSTSPGRKLDQKVTTLGLLALWQKFDALSEIHGSRKVH